MMDITVCDGVVKQPPELVGGIIVEPQTGSAYPPHRKPITDILVLKESRPLWQRAEQGAGSWFLISGLYTELWWNYG